MTNGKSPSIADPFDVPLVGYLQETIRLDAAPKSFMVQTIVALLGLVLIVPWFQPGVVAGIKTTEAIALPTYVSADFQHAIAQR
jgi:hypothetical protein